MALLLRAVPDPAGPGSTQPQHPAGCCRGVKTWDSSKSQYFTATVPHTTMWDTTLITSILCSMVLKRHNSTYYHFSKLWRTFKIGLVASLQILGHFCIPELQFSTCSGTSHVRGPQKQSREEQSAGILVLGVQVPGPRLEFCLENTARGEGDPATKCAQKSEKTNCKAAFPPFSSTLNASMENSF